VTTNNGDWAAGVRLWGSYGERNRYTRIGSILLQEPRDHEVEGYHSHLGTLQAAILNVKIAHLNSWISRRQAIASHYNDILEEIDVSPPHVPDGYEHVYRNYVICLPNRDEIRRRLAEKGIETGILYAPPIHLQTVFAHQGYAAGDLLNTEAVAAQLVCLPMYPELTDMQVEYVCDNLRAALEGTRSAAEA